MATKSNISYLNIKKNSKTKEIVEIELGVPLIIESRGDYWFAYSPDLRLYGKSKSNIENAKKDFFRAVENFLDIHNERGTLEKTLNNFSWSKNDGSFTGAKHTISIKKLSGGIPPVQVKQVHAYS